MGPPSKNGHAVSSSRVAAWTVLLAQNLNSRICRGRACPGLYVPGLYVPQQGCSRDPELQERCCTTSWCRSPGVAPRIPSIAPTWAAAGGTPAGKAAPPAASVTVQRSHPDARSASLGRKTHREQEQEKGECETRNGSAEISRACLDFPNAISQVSTAQPAQGNSEEEGPLLSSRCCTVPGSRSSSLKCSLKWGSGEVE